MESNANHLQLTIIIYGYNEGGICSETVMKSIEVLQKNNINGEVIYVDDGSTDDTKLSLERFTNLPNFTLVRHNENRGIGEAIKTGIKNSKSIWITAIPADGQIPPSELIKLWEKTKNADLITAHFPERFKSSDGYIRRILSTGFHLLCTVAMGGGWKMDGLWMVRKKDLEKITIVSSTFVANIEIPVKLIRMNYIHEKVEVEVKKRMEGSSKILSIKKIIKVGSEILTTGKRIRINTYTKHQKSKVVRK